MGRLTRILLFVILAGSMGTLAFAAGNVEQGKTLFNDPKLGGSTNQLSCNTCHPGGQGLVGVTEKKEFKTPVGTSNSLKTAVNQCVTQALKGKALKPNGEKMADLIAYLGSL